jgi:methylglutamate dehydrogenase subunit B
MRINCPHCGERSLDEFAYHGDATVTRPYPAAPTAMTDFIAYAFERTNAATGHRELWYHSAGCHAFLVVTRNLLTHAITSVEYARDVALARTSNAEERA